MACGVVDNIHEVGAGDTVWAGEGEGRALAARSGDWGRWPAVWSPKMIGRQGGVGGWPGVA